jgi:hypothetical protein
MNRGSAPVVLSAATRALRIHSILQHVLQWCIALPDLVALACTQKCLRDDLLDGTSAHMARWWPPHVLHVTIKDVVKWDCMHASKTGRAVRYLNFSQLDAWDSTRAWIDGWTFPLVSLVLPSHHVFDIPSRIREIERNAHVFCQYSHVVPVPADLQPLQQHVDSMQLDSSAFVSPEALLHAYCFAQYPRMPAILADRGLPPNVVDKCPGAQMVASWLLSPACRSLVSLSIELSTGREVYHPWMRFLVAFLRDLDHLQHLTLKNTTWNHMSFSENPYALPASLTRLSLMYRSMVRSRVPVEIVADDVANARHQGTRPLSIDIHCTSVSFSASSSTHPTNLDTLVTTLATGHTRKRKKQLYISLGLKTHTWEFAAHVFCVGQHLSPILQVGLPTQLSSPKSA